MRARPDGLALGFVRVIVGIWWVTAGRGGRRGFGAGGGRGVSVRGGSSLHLIYFSGAQFPFRVAGGAEGVEEAGGEVDFAGEEEARGFLATAIKIGHGKVLLELVHNNENLNETIGLT